MITPQRLGWYAIPKREITKSPLPDALNKSMRYKEIISEKAPDLAGITKPHAPLAPIDATKRAKKQIKIQQQIRDVEGRSAKQISKLKAEAGEL